MYDKVEKIYKFLQSGITVDIGGTELTQIEENTAIVADCVDQDLNHLQIDVASIKGMAIATGPGNSQISDAVSDVQRVTIATDDINFKKLTDCVDVDLNELVVLVANEDIPISGSVSVSSGTISVDNFPATQPVSGSVTVSGTVSVGNSPAVTVTSGSINATCSGTVNIGNSPAVTVTSGSIGISNTPAVTVSSGSINATCSGTVNVGNSPAVTVTSGSIAISNTPAVTVSSGTVAISGTPAVTVSSGTVSLSGQPISVNQTQFNGVAVSVGSGVNGTGVQRVTMATDDTLFINLTKLITDSRFLTTSYTSLVVGGYSSAISGTDWQVTPNTSGSTYIKTNVQPMCKGDLSYFSSDTSKDYYGAATGAAEFIYESYQVSTTSKNNNAYAPLASDGSDTFVMSSTIYEIVRFYLHLWNGSSTSNIGDLSFQDQHTSKYCRYVPAGFNESPMWYVQVPGSNGIVFFDSMSVNCDHLTNGIYIQLVQQIWNATTTTASQYTDTVLFSTHIKAGTEYTIDLKGLPPVTNATSATISLPPTPLANYRNVIFLFVKADAVGGSSGGVRVNCKTYRA